MSLIERLLGEVHAGLPRLRGAMVHGVLPVHHRVVDELLPLLPGWPAGARVALGPDQRVQIRYGSLHVNARLQRLVALRPSPIVTVELASQLVALGLRFVPLPPFVQVSGRLVQISLADIPLLSDLAPLWPHLAHATCTSTPNGLELAFGFHVVDANAEPTFVPRPRREEDRPMPESGRLQSWIQQQLATGLPALTGARLTGTIPVPVTLLNDLIAQAVADAAAGDLGQARLPAAGLDLAMLARLVKHVRVDAAPGVLTLDFEVGVGD
ncbi:hypothetical protein LuPra_04137 [Luteitalea pratensis]|uniref:Uncharacterized protein n=1 Tax=Luteitalea pratensis TaxID=1855912 RepID=A0A143PSV3_LUTPR|nr:hypothetical protein [Luteitalea pratensis]AMY10894.1 hypothetical protein LuPra_04137 [Luteitalea pratensis]